MISLSHPQPSPLDTPPPHGTLDSCRLAVRAGGLCSGDGGDGGVKAPSVQSLRLLNNSRHRGRVWSRGRRGRGQCGGAGVNNRSDSMCQQLLPRSCPPHLKDPIRLIRFFKMDQFLISEASDCARYAGRWKTVAARRLYLHHCLL